MIRSLYERRPDHKGSILLSIAAHIVAIALIASITFRYPIASLIGLTHETPTQRIRYVEVRPAAAPVGAQKVGNGSSAKPKPKKAAKPAPLLAPTQIPAALPPIPPATASVGAVSGAAGGSGGAPVGVATGVEPALPDPRIALRPNNLRLPMSLAEKNDSAVKAIYLAYREAEIAAEEHKGRDPRDWTFEHNGQKYGIDSSYIYLGKFKVPSAILAALPLNRGGVDGERIIEGRNADWIRNDIYMHSQGMSEDDFRAAVKRIRERKEREHAEEEKDKDKATKIVP